MKPIPPLRLVLSGGGVRGISYVGVFLELEKRGFLKNLKEIFGVSVGGLFGLAYSIKYSPNDLYEFTDSFDFLLMTNIEPDNIFNFFYTFGVDNKENLEKLIDSILRNKGYSTDITFKELYEKTNFYIRFLATNLNKCCAQEFSYKKTPTIKVKFGLLSSMSVPGYFIPSREGDTIYVDGALINNFPMDLLSEYEVNTTLGFTFSEDIHISTIESIEEFFYQIYACMYVTKKNNILNRIREKTIIISSGNYSMMNFNISKEDKNYLIESGRQSVVNYFELKQYVKKPMRRYSVS